MSLNFFSRHSSKSAEDSVHHLLSDLRKQLEKVEKLLAVKSSEPGLKAATSIKSIITKISDVIASPDLHKDTQDNQVPETEKPSGPGHKL